MAASTVGDACGSELLVALRDVDFAIVSSYARACKQLHDYMEVLRHEGYDLLIVPSRGASPFVDGAASFAHRLRDERTPDSAVQSCSSANC